MISDSATITMAKKKSFKFIHAQFLNQLSKKVLVSQVWSGFEFATKPDQPGLSSLIRLEVMKGKRKILVQFI